MAKVDIREISYGGWKNCVWIGNGSADLVVTTDVGPRIIRYGITGKQNQLCEVASESGLTGGDAWRIYGGHRLWHSPESIRRTYEPDNATVAWQEIPNGIRTSQDIEPYSRIKKEMEISLSSEGTSVTVLHRLINRGAWPLELSAWGITALATGGLEVIPFQGSDTGLLPNRSISVWPYTDLSDPRVFFGVRYIFLQHDPAIKQPLKIGIPNERGWAAYFNSGQLYVKHYTHYPHTRYPDLGVSYETYANDYMLEMETLSPLIMVEPDASLEHIERWDLFDHITDPGRDEDRIEQVLRGVLRL